MTQTHNTHESITVTKVNNDNEYNCTKYTCVDTPISLENSTTKVPGLSSWEINSRK
jgi:hypothetical protein